MRRVLSPMVTAAVLVVGCTADDDREATAGAGVEPACDPAIDDALTAWAAAGFSGSIATSVDGAFVCRAA